MDEKTTELISETDSVKVTYSFSGDSPSVKIKFYNKLEKPLYVDWKKSALIKDEVAKSLFGNSVDFSGGINASTYNYSKTSTQINGNFDGKASLPEGSSFVPPHSQVEKTFADVLTSSIIADSAFQILRLPNPYGFTVKSVDFNKTNSPIFF